MKHIQAIPRNPMREIHLSPRDAQIISAGLTHISQTYERWINDGTLPVPRWKLQYLYSIREISEADHNPVAVIHEIASRTSQLKKLGGRVKIARLFSIEACILGVRVTTKLVRHGHLKTKIESFPENAARLITKLEKHRKRHKRAAIRECGAFSYGAERKRWQDFVRLLREHYLRCDCYTRLPLQYFTYRRRRIDTLQEWTTAELKSRGKLPPPTRELRKLLRLMLRYIRSGRRGFTLQFFMSKKIFAEQYCADFMMARWKDLVNAADQSAAALESTREKQSPPKPNYRPAVIAPVAQPRMVIRRSSMRLSRSQLERLQSASKRIEAVPPVEPATPSEYVGYLIREWLDQESIVKSEREVILYETERRLWRMTQCGYKMTPVHGNPLPVIADTRPSRPKPHYKSDLMEYMIEWLLAWLPKAAGDAVICEQAIKIADK